MKIVLVFVFLFFLLSACNDNAPVNSDEMNVVSPQVSLNLVAPNHVKIASDLNALKEKLKIVGKIVTKIEFADPDEWGFSDDKEGYLALVFYIDENNREINMAIADGQFAEILVECSENQNK